MQCQLITVLLGEVPREMRGELFQPTGGKSKPAYPEAAVPPKVIIGEEAVTVADRSLTFQLRGYAPDVLLIQGRLDVENVFSAEVLTLEEHVFAEARRILHEYGGLREFSEQYSIFAVSDYTGPPEQFLEHAPIIAALLKSENLDLDPKEVEYTLTAQIKYAMNDLAILDWDGAFLFDPAADFDEDIELLVLANLQLLRYRLLDRQLDERLKRLGDVVHKCAGGRSVRHAELATDMRETMRIRMSSISALQHLDRAVKLIGDWYSARFYELAGTKFRIEAWRGSIRGKLGAIEDIYAMIAENFSVSAKHRAEWYQIILFFILQAGWFALIILEFWYFTR